MFKKVTQSLVNQIDPKGDLVPVQSILDHEHFRLLCLVRRKRKTIFCPSPRYKRTCYRFDDVLLPREGDKSTEFLFLNEAGQGSSQFTVKKSFSDKVDGSLSLCVDSTRVKVQGAFSLSKGWSIKLEKNHISVPRLDALRTERKLNVNHSFIKQLQKTGQNLYIVHETLENSEETSFEESTKADGSFAAQLYAELCTKGTRESNESIIIPKGCTLAFRAIHLTITDGSWDLDYFPGESSKKFVSDGEQCVLLLLTEVGQNLTILSKLSSDLCAVFLKAIKGVMRDRNLFHELSQKMEAVLDETDSCELKTESPDLKDLLSSLQDSSGHLLKLAGAITYTLDALDELTENQLLLLLESLEEKIVSQQLKLVREHTSHLGGFSVDASLFSFSQEKDEKITIALVGMSGVKLQKDGSAVCTEEASSATAALYVSLYVLDLLSNSD
uniref:Gasdermin pore forming domain-containing protein n=1 Tax=Athene cunicularia TaxID=194338 RepID=A0A663MPH0_ATHCN